MYVIETALTHTAYLNPTHTHDLAWDAHILANLHDILPLLAGQCRTFAGHDN